MYGKTASELLEMIKYGSSSEGIINAYIFKETCEFVEEMANNDFKDAKSQTRRLFKHLIKYKYQPSRQSRSWINTIDNCMVNLQNNLDNDPILKEKIEDKIDDLYKLGASDAAREIGIDKREIKDRDESYTIDNLMDDKFIYDYILSNAKSWKVKKELRKRGYDI